MSRIAKAPIELPSGVEIKFNDNEVSVKGPKGNLVQALHTNVSLEQEDKTITVKPAKDSAVPMAGTFRSGSPSRRDRLPPTRRGVERFTPAPWSLQSSVVVVGRSSLVVVGRPPGTACGRTCRDRQGWREPAVRRSAIISP